MSQFKISPEESEILTQQKGSPYGVLYVENSKVLDDVSVRNFKQELSHYVHTCETNVCIDFTNVRFMAPTAYGGLLAANRTLLATNRNRLAVRNLDDALLIVFRSTAMDKVLEII